VEVDPEQKQRPEQDREHCGESPPKVVQPFEVVVRGGDRDAHDEIDEAEEARTEHATVIPAFAELETAALREVAGGGHLVTSILNTVWPRSQINVGGQPPVPRACETTRAQR
jgi:hypothetical protein